MIDTTATDSTGPESGDAATGARHAAMPTPLDLSRDDGTGIPTRMLVFGMTNRQGTVRFADLLSVGTACGFTSDQIRSCVRRLVSEGMYTREGTGSEGTLTATELGAAELRSGLARSVLAYAQDAAGRGWDRTWHLTAFAVPETRRSERDQFRHYLRILGGAALQNGLYVSPHAWESEVIEAATRLGIESFVVCAPTTALNVGGVTDPRELAASLWPIDELAERYEAFTAAYSAVPDYLAQLLTSRTPLDEPDWLAGVLHIAVRFSECFNADPMLPPELLPRPWPGREAREVLARCRKLGVLTRAHHEAPAFFWMFDDAIAHLP